MIKCNKLDLNNYLISFTYMIPLSYESRMNNCCFIELRNQSFYTKKILDLYDQSYNELKKLFPNYSDI